MPHRTKPIPAGTVNTTINVPVQWRMTVGKIAYAHDLSLGEFVKQCVEKTVAVNESRRVGESLRGMRTSYKITLTLALLILCAVRAAMINPTGPEITAGNVMAIEFDAIMANRVGGVR